MLRITMSVSPEAAARYFDSALEKADYYAKSEANGKGVWGGKGAGRLGRYGNRVRTSNSQNSCWPRTSEELQTTTPKPPSSYGRCCMARQLCC